MLILGIVIIIVGIGTAIYQSSDRHRYHIRMYGDDIIDGYAIIVIGIIFLLLHPFADNMFPETETVGPKVVQTYKMTDVDIVKNNTTEFELTQYNALVVSQTKGLIKTATDAYKGGKIILHDGKETEYEIEEVRESSTVTEPTFKMMSKSKRYLYYPKRLRRQTSLLKSLKLTNRKSDAIIVVASN